MTPQEIIKEIKNLPPIQRKEVLDSISNEKYINENEIAEQLLSKGVIKEIPEDWNLIDEDFEAIKIKGKPLSETVIEDRN
jgi:hypothetical protein